MTEWLPIIQALGLPGAILLMMVFGAYKVIPWLGNTCVKPIVARHIQFIDSVQETLGTVTEKFTDAAADMKKLSDAQAKMAEAQAKLAESQARFTEQATRAASVASLKSGT